MSDIREDLQTNINLAIRIGRLEEAQARQQVQIDELDEKLDGVATKRQVKLVHDKLEGQIREVRGEIQEVRQEVQEVRQEVQEVRQELKGEIKAVEQRVITHVNNKFSELAGLIKGLAVARKEKEPSDTD